MNTEYSWQMDLRDEQLKHAKKEMAKDSYIPNAAVYERRSSDYSQFENAYNTYRVPTTNKFLDLIQANNEKQK